MAATGKPSDGSFVVPLWHSLCSHRGKCDDLFIADISHHTKEHFFNSVECERGHFLYVRGKAVSSMANHLPQMTLGTNLELFRALRRNHCFDLHLIKFNSFLHVFHICLPPNNSFITQIAVSGSFNNFLHSI